MTDKKMIENGICITITANYAIFHGYWEKLCEMKNLNCWAVSEGLDRYTTYCLTKSEAKQIGIVINE